MAVMTVGDHNKLTKLLHEALGLPWYTQWWTLSVDHREGNPRIVCEYIPQPTRIVDNEIATEVTKYKLVWIDELPPESKL